MEYGRTKNVDALGEYVIAQRETKFSRFSDSEGVSKQKGIACRLSLKSS
jgi:hypothetical protein